MNKKRKPNTSKICSQCKQARLRDILKTEVYDGVIVTNIPATYCENCGEELYSFETTGMLDKILNDPDRYAEVKKVAIADFSAVQKTQRRRAA